MGEEDGSSVPPSQTVVSRGYPYRGSWPPSLLQIIDGKSPLSVYSCIRPCKGSKGCTGGGNLGIGQGGGEEVYYDLMTDQGWFDDITLSYSNDIDMTSSAYMNILTYIKYVNMSILTTLTVLTILTILTFLTFLTLP